MKKITLSSPIIKKLKSLGVGIVYFFGSRAQGTALDHSDYDLGVVFVSEKKLKEKSIDLYGKVYTAISSDIPDKLDGPKLDLSFLQTASPALQMAAVKNGQILFEIDPITRADYEESVIKKYDDYLPLKKEYEQATITAFR